MAIGVSVLLQVIEIAQNERVHKGIAQLWERTKWGRDKALKERAEALTDRYIADVRGLAMTLALESVGDGVSGRTRQLEVDFGKLGIPEPEARELASKTRDEVEAAVLAPTREIRALQERMISAEETAQRAEANAISLGNDVRKLRGLASAACAFALAALLLAFVVFLKH